MLRASYLVQFGHQQSAHSQPAMNTSMTAPLVASLKRSASRRGTGGGFGSGAAAGDAGPSMTEMEALIAFVELMDRSSLRPTVPECRAALLNAAGGLQVLCLLGSTPLHCAPPRGRSVPVIKSHKEVLASQIATLACFVPCAGLGSAEREAAEPLPPGTLPETLPEARVSVLLQNLGLASNSIVVRLPLLPPCCACCNSAQSIEPIVCVGNDGLEYGDT